MELPDTTEKDFSESACANTDHELFACERPRGHDGPHRALIEYDGHDTVEWESDG